MLRKVISSIRKHVGITRSKTWRLYSDEYLGEEVNVCFTGSEIQKNFIKRALFPASGSEVYMGARFHYRLSPIGSSQRFDITIAEKLYDDQLPDIDRLHWELPHWVHTYADIPLTKLSSSFKSDLRLIRKNGLDYRVTVETNDIRDFYDNMYLPLVTQRHGDSSIPMQLEELLAAVASKQCELLLVLREGRPISGMVMDYRGNLPNLWSVGVLDANRDLITIGAIPASYHFCFVHLQDNGFSRVSLGLCRAFVDDGVLKFKRKFTSKMLAATDRGFIILPTRMSDGVQELLKQNAFIHRDNGRLKLATFIDKGESPEDTQTAIQKKYTDLDLAGSDIYRMADNKAVKVLETPFDGAANLEGRQVTDNPSEQDPSSLAATYMLRHMMNIRAEQSMLLYADELSDPDSLSIIESAATGIGLKVDRLQLTPGASQSDQSRQIEQQLMAQEYDVICEASGQYFYNTPSWRLAHQRGIRTFGLGPLGVNALVDCVGKVDYHKVFYLAERIAQLIRGSNSLYLTDANGSELSIQFRRPLSNKVLSKLKLQTPFHSIVHSPTGFLSNTVNSTFLGGQLSFIGYPPGINGKIVVDSFLWPPKQLGPLENHVTLDIVAGRISRISGGAEASVYSQSQPLSERNLEHICIGLNPGANIRNNLMEAERALGACNFGFGVYPFHTDGVIAKPTLVADNKVLIDNGVISEDL